jgi:hypothetical protein
MNRPDAKRPGFTAKAQRDKGTRARREEGMKRVLLCLGLAGLVAAAQALEMKPLFKVGMQDIALGGVNLKGKTLLLAKTTFFDFGAGVRIHELFGAMLSVNGLHDFTLATEGLKSPYLSYTAIGSAPISFSAFWFPKRGARARKPFVFGSFTWVHTMLKDIYTAGALTHEFPRNYLGIGAGYTLYAITPHIQFEFVPAWGALSYSFGVQTGGIFDW